MIKGMPVANTVPSVVSAVPAMALKIVPEYKSVLLPGMAKYPMPSPVAVVPPFKIR